MKVGEVTKSWENGVGMCADTSFVHSTGNDSETADRYVLIIRFWHPELTRHERNGVRFLFDAFEDLSERGLARARANARARTEADEREPAAAGGGARAEAGVGAGPEPVLSPPSPGGEDEKKKRRNRKRRPADSSSGLGLLSRGMK
jgi:aspartate beta-hydroxylase